MNYHPTQHVSVDESMVPYFGDMEIWKYGAKRYIHGKSIKFGFKLWVMATALGCCIQFRPYAGKDSILQEYGNIGLGLGASVVANLVSKLSVIQTSNYHIVMYNYFTSPALLRHLSAMVMENALLRDMVKMNKEKRGSSDAVTDVSSNITAVYWKDNKVVSVISTFTGTDQFNRTNVIVIVKSGE